MEGTKDTEFSNQLRVTDRGLDIYRDFVHFVPEDMVQNALLVNVGGGENQTFEKQLKVIRPDIKVITLDPSVFTENAIYQVEAKDSFKLLSVDEIKERAKNLPNKAGTIKAYGQNMPLRSNLADVVLDVHAASQWAKNMEEYKAFIKESMRVLKPGGKLYIGNVYFGDPIPGDKKSENSSLKQARKVFEELSLNSEVFLSQESILSEFRGKKDVADNRVCAIITKQV